MSETPSSKISELPTVVAANLHEADALPVVTSGVTSKVAISDIRSKLDTSGVYQVQHPVFGGVGDGIADDTVAVQAAFDAARLTGGSVVISGGKQYRTTAPINVTFSATDVATARHAITVRFESIMGLGPDASSGCIIADHTGHVFDCAGLYDSIWVNPNVKTAAGKNLKSCWFFARNSANSSAGKHVLIAPRVWGSFVNGIVYSYASEENEYIAPRFVNTYAGGEVFCVTVSNIRALTSSFIAIATGVQSNIVLNMHGGSLHANSAGGRVWYLDGASSVRAFGTWMYAASGVANGHSLVYVDTTNVPSDNCTFESITGENGAFLQQYGFYFGDAVGTPSGWKISGRVASATRAIFGHANVIFDRLNVNEITEPSSKGIAVTNIQGSLIKGQDTVIVIAGTSTRNLLIVDTDNLTVAVRNKDVWINMKAGTIMPAQGVAFQATQVPSADANTLDDYEEGVWVPVLGGATSETGQAYSNQVGKYVKIGRLVICTFMISLTNAGAVTGAATLKGLPFAADNGVGFRASVNLGEYDGLGIAVVQLSAYVEHNSTTAVFNHRIAAAASSTASPNTLWGATTLLIGTVSYITAN